MKKLYKMGSRCCQANGTHCSLVVHIVTTEDCSNLKITLRKYYAWSNVAGFLDDVVLSVIRRIDMPGFDVGAHICMNIVGIGLIGHCLEDGRENKVADIGISLMLASWCRQWEATLKPHEFRDV